MMRKIVPILFSLLLILAAIPAGKTMAASETVPAEMKAMIDAGIISGYNDGTYKPNGKVTRGEFANFLQRALKLPNGPHVFKDVSKSSKLAAGINAAAKAKIVSGVTADTFAPNQLISREQMAMMINNALAYKKVPQKTANLNLQDFSQIKSSVARKAIMNMTAYEIIKGYPVEKGFVFKAKDDAIRAHAAAFINRMLKVTGPVVSEATTTQSTTYEPSAYEKKVVELTNVERTKQGLKPLILNVSLNKVAHEKAEDMKRNNYFSHTSPTYGSPFDMMKKFGISYMAAGENIAKGQVSPEEVVKAWMNSAGHRQNILNPSFTEMGAGYVGPQNIWVQMFIGK
ncbi:S-layer homology domain-containing protein [Bacillus testis]|uniref:S-layer homology domain-containing protein n=1 Tax=Bacillus testis TaxID=1622072 RepID=UPI0009E62163|nr:S-layer homology domain-containing protein [Bacillus testis]